MQLFAPSVYKNFKCIADKCQHNCCIGWEIDIDAESLENYRNHPEIMQNISLDGAPHFVLGEHDRCPFLQSDNLCELIKQYGDGALCQICRDHPRFYNEFASRTEVGVGLTCETAAKLILDTDFALEILSESGELAVENIEETEFFEYRDEIFSRKPSDFKCLLPDITVSRLAKVFKKLERLDAQWDGVLDSLNDRREKLTETDIETVFATRLFHYFVFRHLHRYGLDFCVLCTAFICCLDGDVYENARMFSSEIEYSDENIELLIAEALE